MPARPACDTQLSVKFDVQTTRMVYTMSCDDDADIRKSADEGVSECKRIKQEMVIGTLTEKESKQNTEGTTEQESKLVKSAGFLNPETQSGSS
eukprot:426367-Amphidinium_carterae.1